MLTTRFSSKVPLAAAKEVDALIDSKLRGLLAELSTYQDVFKEIDQLEAALIKFQQELEILNAKLAEFNNNTLLEVLKDEIVVIFETYIKTKAYEDIKLLCVASIQKLLVRYEGLNIKIATDIKQLIHEAVINNVPHFEDNNYFPVYHAIRYFLTNRPAKDKAKHDVQVNRILQELFKLNLNPCESCADNRYSPRCKKISCSVDFGKRIDKQLGLTSQDCDFLIALAKKAKVSKYLLTLDTARKQIHDMLEATTTLPDLNAEIKSLKSENANKQEGPVGLTIKTLLAFNAIIPALNRNYFEEQSGPIYYFLTQFILLINSDARFTICKDITEYQIIFQQIIAKEHEISMVKSQLEVIFQRQDVNTRVKNQPLKVVVNALTKALQYAAKIYKRENSFLFRDSLVPANNLIAELKSNKASEADKIDKVINFLKRLEIGQGLTRHSFDIFFMSFLFNESESGIPGLLVRNSIYCSNNIFEEGEYLSDNPQQPSGKMCDYLAGANRISDQNDRHIIRQSVSILFFKLKPQLIACTKVAEEFLARHPVSLPQPQ